MNKKIAYFGTPVQPKLGQNRKVLFFTLQKDSPDSVFSSTGSTTYTKSEFGEKFIYGGNVCTIRKPVLLPERYVLYVNHEGILFIADAENSALGKKEIGSYDFKSKKFYSELEGDEENY